MKFELEPYNRGVSDEVMLEDLRKVAGMLSKDFVTMLEYGKHGRFDSTTLKRRFSSWCEAHELAGLRRSRHYKTTQADCLSSIRRIAERLGKKTITTADYLENGGLSLSIVKRHFGSWKAALGRAGLCVSPQYHERATQEQLFENIERLWELLGRQPRTQDFSDSISHFSSCTYKRRFGSLRKALEAFVASVTNEKMAQSANAQEHIADPVRPQIVIKTHKTSRTVNWRLKFLVMQRDNFRCCFCGRSQADGVKLQVDHIDSWDGGGETVMENLQTLCEPCNGGKSNLPMNES